MSEERDTETVTEPVPAPVAEPEAAATSIATAEPAAASEPAGGEATPHVPRPAGRRRGPRRRVVRRPGLVHAGLGSWSAPLIVVLLSIVAFRFPFFTSPEPANERFGPAPPFARSGVELRLSPVLALDAMGVRLDGRRVASADDVARGHVELTDLEIHRRNWGELHPDQPWPARVILDVPPGTPWSEVRAVTLAAARAGCPHIAFLVMSPTGDPPFDWARFREP